MLKIIRLRLSSLYCKRRISFLVACLLLICSEVSPCSPGRSGARRRSARKLTPLVFKQHVPNIAEHSLGASGAPEGRIWRDDARFKNLVPNYNSDIVFKDEEGTGVDRLMTRRCKEKLDILAISVMNMWPGIRLRVTEGFDEEGHHPKNSLHYEGRAVAISTSDRDTSKYGMLARLAVDAGFDWVFFESRAHIYCSVKTESTVSSRFSGCFHGSTQIITKNGMKSVHALEAGEEILAGISSNSILYSKVIGFLHRDPHLVTNFIQINTSSNNTLLVTKEHLVFRHTWEPVYAANLIPGDFIWIMAVNGTLEESIVTSINYMTLKGAYAPLTNAGTIVVDGILSSCYAVFNNHDLAHLVFWPLRLLYQLGDNIGSFVGYIRFSVLNGNWTHIANEETIFKEKDKESYIHWYAVLLCDLSGMFITICK